MGRPLKRGNKRAETQEATRAAGHEATGTAKRARGAATEAGKEHPYPAARPPPGRPDVAGDPAYQPARTPLGAELRRLRAKIIESGEPLLDWADIEREVAKRRGGAGR